MASCHILTFLSTNSQAISLSILKSPPCGCSTVTVSRINPICRQNDRGLFFSVPSTDILVTYEQLLAGRRSGQKSDKYSLNSVRSETTKPEMHRTFLGLPSSLSRQLPLFVCHVITAAMVGRACQNGCYDPPFSLAPKERCCLSSCSGG